MEVNPYVMDSDDIEYFKNLPSGVRFRPTEEQLISAYLKPKLFNQPLPRNEIIEANIYQYNPKILTEIYKRKGQERLYFFTPTQRKYPNGDRPNRSTGDGYWKATGADKTINDIENNVIGFKKSLVFYEGKPPGGCKSHWIMHEYRVNDAPRRKRTSANDMRLDDSVLCMIYYKDTKKPIAKTNTDTDKDPLSTSHDDHPIVGSTTSLDHLIPSTSNLTSVESTPSHDDHLIVRSTTSLDQLIPSTSNLTSVESTPSHDIDNHHLILHPVDDLDMQNCKLQQQPLENDDVYLNLDFLDKDCEEGFSMDIPNDGFVEKVLNDKPMDDDSPSSNLFHPDDDLGRRTD